MREDLSAASSQRILPRYSPEMNNEGEKPNAAEEPLIEDSASSQHQQNKQQLPERLLVTLINELPADVIQ